jgi:hypothetical protein
MKSCSVVYIRPAIIVDSRDKGKRFHPDEHAETATTFLGAAGCACRAERSEATGLSPLRRNRRDIETHGTCCSPDGGRKTGPGCNTSRKAESAPGSPCTCAHTHRRTYAGNGPRSVRCGICASRAQAKETVRYMASIRILPAEGYSLSPASSLPVMVSSSYLVSSRRYSALLSRFCQTWSVNSFGTTLSTLPIAWSPSHCVA